MLLIAAFISLVFFYSLISGRLERTIFTAPILFTAAGALMAISPEALNELVVDRKSLLLVAELGLVMILFAEASRINLGMRKGYISLPARLLGTGMPLTIVLGLACAVAGLRTLTLAEAGILAATLAPTDAGLGQAIVNSPQVPNRIRHGLNVEAGLNDGLAVPVMMFFIALAQAGAGNVGGALFSRFMLEQLGYGTLIGLAIGLGGGKLLSYAQRKEWMAESLVQLGVVSLPLGCVVASEMAGASMFIAAFVAGIAVQTGFRDVEHRGVEFTEGLGNFFNLFVFFIFGLLITRIWGQFTFAIFAYAVMSLTVIRVVPVAIALRGTGLSRSTVLFMGWFGPRGLASIVLALVYVEGDVRLPGEPIIDLAVMATVLLSIFAHGFTAHYGVSKYAAAIETLSSGAPEHETAIPDQKRVEDTRNS